MRAEVLLATVLMLSAGSPSPGAEPGCGAFDHDHRVWTGLLARHVRAGRVDYAGLRQRESADLDAYLHGLSAVTHRCYDGWASGQRLAFWINAYNAFTVRLVLDHYPLASIRDIGLLPLAAFRQKIVPMPELRGATLSLNDVENDVLRGEFHEPRIHFAIVCASKSCPALRAEAYRAPDLDRQLDDQARSFLADPTRNRVDAAGRTLFLSSIFKWFHGDFEAAAGTVPTFVARYLDPAGAAVARAPGVTVRYLDYDWSLNGQ